MKKTAHFYCYGIIGEADPLFQAFTGEPDPIISAEKVSEFIRNLDDEITEIVVHINSRGGNAFEGFSIHDLFATSGKKITTIAEGLVASIATVVFLSGSVRKITETSQLMVHNPWVPPTLIAGLTADEIQEMANYMKEQEERIVDFYVNKTGADKSTIADMMKEETFIAAEKAIELKFATEIMVSVNAKVFAYYYNTKNKNSEMKTLMQKVDELMNFVKGKSKVLIINAEAMKTKDGKTINIDGGVKVGSTVSDADGNPTPNASYTLEDGTGIKTDTDSKISDVTKPVQDEAVKVGDVLKNEKGELHINAEVKINDKLTAKTNDKGEITELIDTVESENKDIVALAQKVAALEASNKEKDGKIAQYEATQAEIENKLNLIAKEVKSTHVPRAGLTIIRKLNDNSEEKTNRLENLPEEVRKEQLEKRKKVIA